MIAMLKTAKNNLFIATMITAVVMLFGTAWISDDGFITMRVIDNFVNGWGLRFNVIERVQVFTHPLWLMLVTPVYFFLRNVLLANMLVSVVVSFVALWLLATKLASNLQRGCLLVLAALISNSIMSFLTSGLETPLTFLLLALFVLQFNRPGKTWITAAIAGLLFLNRLDLVVLIGPVIVCLIFQERGITGRIKIAMAAGLPVVLWTAFSLVYYGAPFPNTAYAKLGTGIDRLSLIVQGLNYTWYFIQADPLLVLIIGKAVFDTLMARQLVTKLLGAGIILYIFYTIFIGGDFMLGRFFTAPGFLAVCLLARSTALPALNEKANVWVVFAAIILCWISVTNRNVHQDYWATLRNGIADERLAYYEHNGFVSLVKDAMGYAPAYADQGWKDLGEGFKIESRLADKKLVVLTHNPGTQGFYAGPNVHMVDVLALTDPFLARLPAVAKPVPRVGHYMRLVPSGYSETILDAAPVMPVQSLRPLLNDVTLAARAPLFRPERWSAIWRLLFAQENYDFSDFKNGVMENAVYEYANPLPRLIK